ncbi:hypothetical protein K432DRAFT_378486 [Lepidopterella palustris CBS 459.81]|uniref:Uncharacterized protein n=1 Tax=Lepidopterella palustris CBS 459.81 TaxID=1314670 RepID=A0A8E2EIQ3_9PEZI|nr:hypothetical protein K432DRAFT_378486 [Lepidopterella palustris CBS 459.81]
METCSGGEGDSRTIVVGWNKAAVWGMAAQIGAKQAEEKHEKRKEEWGEVLEAHREFVKNNAKKSPKTFAYKNAVGSYAVLVDIAMAGPLGLEAAFDFGLLEGTMLLADSTVKLELLRDEHEGSEKEDDEDEDDDEDDDNAGVRGGKKRQAPSVVPKARKAKSRKPNPAHPRRIYLQWRGRETQENEIQLDYDNSNTGYIDFTDNACTKFEGVASFSLVGEDVAFEGLKIGTTPQARAEPWSNFSEEEYESARVGRWH